MRVFSACLKIMKRRKLTFIIYFSVFAVLLLCMTLWSNPSMYGGFTSQKPDYALINRDSGSAVSSGLAKVLADTGNFVELEDSREAMQDAGFNQAVECIFVIPEGYGKSFMEDGGASLQMWQWPSSASGYYLRSAAEQYLSLVQMYRKIGKMTEEEIAEAAAASMKQETEVTVRQYTDGVLVSEKITFYQRFLPYVLLLLCISGVNVVFLYFRKPEIRMRNLCSPVRPFSFALQKFLYACVVGAGAWVLLNVMGTVVCWKDWSGVDLRMYLLYLANSMCMMLAAVSLALLCSTVISGENVMSFVTNIVALGMCFLSGTFVSMELMGEGILRVAKLVPVYWYEENAVRISSLTGFAAENLRPIWEGMAIQIGFAAAFFCVYLLVNKYRQQAEEDFGSVRTEVEQ